MNSRHERLIYFDNAATSWPKPPGVAAAMTRFIGEIGANPGRSGHRLAVDSSRVVYATREAVAQLFNALDPLRVVFGGECDRNSQSEFARLAAAWGSCHHHQHGA